MASRLAFGATLSGDPLATRRASASREALPKEQRQGIALCLSGGGYRAALFHLGALRRLNELGVLGRVSTITSVSGGTIFAAQLALHLAKQPTWPIDGPLPDWEQEVAEPLRAFMRTNIRTGAILSRFKPRNWFNGRASIEALARSYAEGISDADLTALPRRPRFVICATDMEFGLQWVFDSGQGRMGSEAAGYVEPFPVGWPLSRAVAASSCVPGVFPPLEVTNDPRALRGGSYDREDRDERVTSIDLTDGGMFDNLGVEPVWRDHEIVLVSHGAPTYQTFKARLPIWRQLRHIVILLDQSTEVRKRWLLDGFERGDLEGTYWSLGSLPSHYPNEPGRRHPDLRTYSDALVEQRIAGIRIDLDAFTSGEIAVIENHGYGMADLAVRAHAPQAITHDAPPAVPHPRWMDEGRARRALETSAYNTLLGRR
jgi:NTE family protein